MSKVQGLGSLIEENGKLRTALLGVVDAAAEFVGAAAKVERDEPNSRGPIGAFSAGDDLTLTDLRNLSNEVKAARKVLGI